MFPYKPFIDEALVELGFKTLTEVQTIVIPKIIKGQDLIVQSATGTGKTHGYLIPIFEKLDPELKECQVVISAPTRELATQIFAFAKQIKDHSKTNIDIRLFTGGSNRNEEIARLHKGQPHIAIGTPGKLKDLVVKANALKAHQAKILIVDEADMTLDEGFLEDVDQVAATMNQKLQMLVFSATIPESIQPFLKKYLKNPENISLSAGPGVNQNVRHFFIKTKERDRQTVFTSLLSTLNPYLAIIFCNTKESADIVYAQMKADKLNVALIHGGLEARKRKLIVSDIRALKYQYVVATDIVSRGIDIHGISHIINYELPKDIEFYVHRSGRTGRMDKDGMVLSLYEFSDNTYMNMLEAKGIKALNLDIKGSELVEAKSRNTREKKEWKPGTALLKATSKIKRPTTVKPGYKKKYSAEVEAVKKKFTRRGL
jgi:ATP-dependent RNA helicase CshB